MILIKLARQQEVLHGQVAADVAKTPRKNSMALNPENWVVPDDTDLTKRTIFGSAADLAMGGPPVVNWLKRRSHRLAIPLAKARALLSRSMPTTHAPPPMRKTACERPDTSLRRSLGCQYR